MRRTILAGLVLAAACAAPTEPVARVLLDAPSFGYIDTSRPVPVPLSAERVATVLGIDSIRVTYLDTETDATLTSVYVSGGADFAATQNIPGDAATGERVETIAIAAGYTTLRLRNLWIVDPLQPDLSAWSAFSDPIPVTDAAAIATTATKRGKKR